jgi:hypothetical protein
MVRIILNYPNQISEDHWNVGYETIKIDSPELEQLIKEGKNVVGAEIIAKGGKR